MLTEKEFKQKLARFRYWDSDIEQHMTKVKSTEIRKELLAHNKAQIDMIAKLADCLEGAIEQLEDLRCGSCGEYGCCDCSVEAYIQTVKKAKGM